MAKKKSRSSRMSTGKTKEIRKAREAKRQAKFAAKREAGNAYEYKPNPYKKGTSEYEAERLNRAEKAKSCKTEVQWYRSQFAKLDNALKKKKTSGSRTRFPSKGDQP